MFVVAIMLKLTTILGLKQKREKKNSIIRNEIWNQQNRLHWEKHIDKKNRQNLHYCISSIIYIVQHYLFDVFDIDLDWAIYKRYQNNAIPISLLFVLFIHDWNFYKHLILRDFNSKIR